MKILLAILLIFLPITAHAAPKVVTSIKPVHAIAAAIMDGVGEPVWLAKNNHLSPDYKIHHYQRDLIMEANLVVWVGPELEKFMIDPVAKTKARLITWAHSKGMKKLDGSYIWLNPINAKNLGQEIAFQLGELDPKNAAIYTKNAETFDQQMQSLDQWMNDQFKTSQRSSFISLDGSYAYLVDRYGLNHMKNINTENIKTARETIAKNQAHCVVADHTFSYHDLQEITSGLDVKIARLNIWGTQMNPGAGLYEKIMRQMTINLQNCLQKAILHTPS